MTAQKRCSLWCIALFLLTGIFSTGLATADELLDDSWFVITLGSDYFGLLRSQVSQTTWQEQPVISTYEYMEFTLSRMGLELKATMHSTYIDTLAHEPIYFKSEMDISNMKTVTEGHLSGRDLTITQNIGGQVQKHSLTLDDKTIFPSSKFKESHVRQLVPGNVFVMHLFVPDFLTVVKTTVTVMDYETISIEGQQFQTIKTMSTNDLTPTMPTTEWVDNNGNILQFESSLLGNVVRGTKTTRELALHRGPKGPTLDVFRDLLIQLEGPIIDPDKASNARFKLEFKKEPDQLNLINDNRQKIIERKDNVLILHIEKIPLPAKTGLNMPNKNQSLAQFTVPTQFIQSNDPKILAQARQIVKNEKDIVRAARKINTWVYDNIKKKNLNVGFASASEVMQSLEGDCSEHSVLAAALCRAVGIPARLCIGLMYSPQLKAFGYHLWFEIHAGQWFQLDPTFNQEAVDVTHILISRGDLNGTQLMQASADLNAWTANLNIKVLEINYSSD